MVLWSFFMVFIRYDDVASDVATVCGDDDFAAPMLPLSAVITTSPPPMLPLSAAMTTSPPPMLPLLAVMTIYSSILSIV
ncbi:hypothetical protein DPMN_068608 [Dreissena polymorpha]|uniref:Secreted peptide n=1 Tax=Dreissena polymorpha TaxID=45954 RepID=A0A9D3YZH4_DREPO|nr:hypothetical protein DPMN_068608 [Dreissena polymorpha]